MKKIIFNSVDEFKIFIENNSVIFIGEGSEGKCFLGKDGDVYKDLTEGYYVENYDIDEIITEEDILLDSFNFPKTLFVIDDQLVGYTARYFDNDIFGNNNLGLPKIEQIDFDKLLEARFKMIEDIRILTENQIGIFDLSYNLLFDGEKLVGVDTLGYYRDPCITFEQNIGNLDTAIKDAINGFFIFSLDEEKYQGIDKNQDTESFLKQLQKRVIKKKDKPNQKKKTRIY